DIESFLSQHMAQFEVSRGYAVVCRAGADADSWKEFQERLNEFEITPLPLASFDNLPRFVRRFAAEVVPLVCSRIVLACPWIHADSEGGIPAAARYWGLEIERLLEQEVGPFRFVAARPFSSSITRGMLTELILEASERSWRNLREAVPANQILRDLPVVEYDF